MHKYPRNSRLANIHSIISVGIGVASMCACVYRSSLRDKDALEYGVIEAKTQISCARLFLRYWLCLKVKSDVDFVAY
jgi:hypothetical protein